MKAVKLTFEKKGPPASGQRMTTAFREPSKGSHRENRIPENEKDRPMEKDRYLTQGHYTEKRLDLRESGEKTDV